MNKKLTLVIPAIVFLSLTLLASASAETEEQKPATIDCSYGKDYLEGLKTNLTDLQHQAARVGREICASSLKVLPDEIIQITDQLTNFAAAAKLEFDRIFPAEMFTDASELSSSWYALVTRPTNDYRNFALIEGVRRLEGMPPVTNLELKLYADPAANKIYKLSDAQKAHCNKVITDSSITLPNGEKDCHAALKLWSNAVSPFQYFSANDVLKKNGQKITSLQTQWKTFIEDSSYQTPLDVWVTTAWYSDQYKANHLSGPPSTQLFLLHPTIVYEHLPDADKGSREDVSLAIEWVGINWWQSGFGFSITSVYKDREDQPSTGTGLTLHIKNKYSLGYAYRDDGDDSIFFNLDLLEWFGDKEEKYEKYKAYF
jgi:hypothetical protein